MKTTGPNSTKEYKCRQCGAIEKHGTNHWGTIYCKCRTCGWKHPMQFGGMFDCLEPMPAEYEKPVEWKMVKLSDICKVI